MSETFEKSQMSETFDVPSGCISGGSRGARDACSLPVQFFFIFMQFSEKIMGVCAQSGKILGSTTDTVINFTNFHAVLGNFPKYRYASLFWSLCASLGNHGSATTYGQRFFEVLLKSRKANNG